MSLEAPPEARRTVLQRQPFLLVLLSIVLFASELASGPSVLADDAVARSTPSTVGVAVDLGQPANEAPALEAARRGYDLLLRHYVHPLEPRSLLVPAYDAIVPHLQEEGVRVRRPTLELRGPGVEDAWQSFAEAVGSLIRESESGKLEGVNAIALQAMAESVGEGHTQYLPPSLYKRLVAQMRGEERESGIGIRLNRPDPTIAEVVEGSPAEQAGLIRGDTIVGIGGQAVDGLPIGEIVKRLRGADGTAVVLRVLRRSTGEVIDIEVIRATFTVEQVYGSLLEGSVGYIRVRGFTAPDVADSFDQILGEVTGGGADSLILDLRGNSGGRVDLGTRMLSRLVSSGPLYQEVNRSGVRRVVSAQGTAPEPRVPIAVLIDDSSASMSEIFASALQERGLARLFGTSTAGVVAAAQPFPLPDGSALQITVREIASGTGQLLNRRGVVPDEEIETSPDNLAIGRDAPLEAAIHYLWAERDRRAHEAAAPS